MYVYLSNILLRFLNLQLKKHQKFPVTIFLDFRELLYVVHHKIKQLMRHVLFSIDLFMLSEILLENSTEN